MADSAFLAVIGGIIQFLIDQGWKLVAGLADLARFMGPFSSALFVVAVAAIAYAVALVMQMRIERLIEEEPEEPVNLWKQELMFSLPVAAIVAAFLPIILIALAVRKVVQWITSFFGDEEEAEEEEKEPVPILVATIGPSFMGAGITVAVLYLLSRAVEPLLASQLDLSPGYPAWQYVLIGHRPELHWYLPLDRFPFVGGMAAFLVWLTIWWWAGRIVRLVLRKDLGENIADRMDSPSLLPSWRKYFGSYDLYQLDASYRKWARWLPLVALPLLAWAWMNLGGDPYRMEGSMFAAAFLVWLSWAMHMSLSGLYRPVAEEAEEEEEAEARPLVAWPEVLEDLQVRYQVEEPIALEMPRLVPEFDAEERPGGGLISDLLFGHDGGGGPLGEGGLTRMQLDVLETLSRQAFVHLDPPTQSGSLELKQVSAPGIRDESGMRHANQIVLAPDGSGKTTLAMLAAFNNTLVHSRGTLIVVRDAETARELEEQIRNTLEPSTLRWTIRTRLAGPNLVNDLAKGIVPDVVVTSLDQLVTGILADARTNAGFLNNLGLVVIDDVQSFCGPMETHMQLAFRRLILRLRELQGTRQLGNSGASDPVALVLGVDSMFNTATWAKTLCGIDAVTRVYEYSSARERLTPDDLLPDPADPADVPDEAETPVEDESNEAATASAQTPDEKGEGAQADPDSETEPPEPEFDSSSPIGMLAHAPAGRYHLFYHLADFESESGEKLGVQELVNACERAGVPWHYRRCGDLFRTEGRSLLRLAEEPLNYVSDPAKAGVVMLDGPLGTVKREIDHLLRAGSDFGDDDQAEQVAIPVAFVSIVDPDERMALTETDPNSSLAGVINTFPRPIVRAPTGRAVEAHLSADLVNTWMEVADILEVFGSGTVRTLHRLSKSGLVAEPHTDLDENQAGYEELLHVRLPAKAVAADEETYANDRAGHLLPPSVRQVSLPPGPSVAIRDHTSLTTIAESDLASARYIYYTGRILETAQGRYIVIGQAGGDSADEGGPLSEHDILVEPFLNDDISSPRRRSFVRPLRADENVPGERNQNDENYRETEPVFIGDYPVATSLRAVEVHTNHLATFRLDPRDLRVRQRVLFFGPETPTDEEAIIRTDALGIMPNPDMDVVAEDACPRLQLRDARLIAAAMRAVLQSMYRGSEVDLDVAIHVEDAQPAPTYELGPNDGFYLFDPHVGGNGTARAIARDGVELLLRLCRVYLERVLFHERLRARFDWWADEDELLGRQKIRRPSSRQEARESDQVARKRALTWLDSRLLPEGSVTGGRRQGQYGIGSEEGEGDIIDIGRCWYSRDGNVTDLVWTKHRWMLDDGTEAMCDVGIGRETAASSQLYRVNAAHTREHVAWLKKQLGNPAFRMDDQLIWGSPYTVWSLTPGESIPVGSDANRLKEPAVVDRHVLALASVAHSYRAFGPLADLLAAQLEADATTEEGRLMAARLVADFVQGIPFSSASAPDELQGPLRALVGRLGTYESQSLLLAVLLKQMDIDSGVFLHPPTGRMLAAAALPEVPQAPNTTELMLDWREEHIGPDRKVMWGELPLQPGATRGRHGVFVPIEVNGHEELGVAELREPTEWVFLPLAWAWVRTGVETIEVPGVASAPADQTTGDE